MNGTIVVTGAARGIGRAIAEKMASTGPLTVIGVDIAPELALSESIIPVQVDLTSIEGPGLVTRSGRGIGVAPARAGQQCRDHPRRPVDQSD